MSPVLEAVTSYFLPCILITLLPGPGTMVVPQASVAGGHRDGLRAALGVTAGPVVWSVVLGLGLILTADTIALLLFKVICWLAGHARQSHARRGRVPRNL